MGPRGGSLRGSQVGIRVARELNQQQVQNSMEDTCRSVLTGGRGGERQAPAHTCTPRTPRPWGPASPRRAGDRAHSIFPSEWGRAWLTTQGQRPHPQRQEPLSW